MGILRRCVIVVDGKGEMLELVNPEIISRSETVQDGLEGCLSVPGMWGMVERPMQVRVRAQDRSGQTFEADRGPLLLPRDRPSGRASVH